MPPAHGSSIWLSEQVALVLMRQMVHLRGWSSRNGTDRSGQKIFFLGACFVFALRQLGIRIVRRIHILKSP